MEAIIAHDGSGTSEGYVTPRAVTRTGIDDVAPIVFIIDGDIAVRQSLERLIRSAGWDAEPFAWAEKFLSHSRDAVPCCLILDLTLPGLSGLELQQQLAGRPDMPVIFFTSHTDVPMAVQAMKAGAVEFLIKPFNDAALLYVIRAAIERSRAALRQRSESSFTATPGQTLPS